MARQLFISSLEPQKGNFHYYNLPKGLLEFTLLDVGASYTINVEKKIVPDPDHRYFLAYTNTGRSNDIVTINFNEEGYLSVVNIDTEDVTLQVIEKVIESVKDAVVPTTRGDGDGAGTKMFSEIIDPFNQTEVDALVKRVQKATKWERFYFRFKSLAKVTRKGMGDVDQYGILCKPMELCELRYGLDPDPENEDDLGFDTQMLFKMPHPDVTHLISVPNAPFVKSTLVITFGEYGYPTEIVMNQPSWWSAVAEMPGKIFKGLFALPSQLVQLRVNYMNDQTDNKQKLIEARKELKEQKKLTLAARQELKEKSTEPTEPTEPQEPEDV